MKYLLDVKIEPRKHYIHVKGKIENAISNAFYLNENFHMLYAKADNIDISFKMDIVAPHPAFDVISRPVIFETKLENIEFEYEGYVPEIIADINQIDGDIVELASYAGWYPKPILSGTAFDFDIKVDLPYGYELASNGTIHNNTHITSTDGDNDDIVCFK